MEPVMSASSKPTAILVNPQYFDHERCMCTSCAPHVHLIQRAQASQRSMPAFFSSLHCILQGRHHAEPRVQHLAHGRHLWHCGLVLHRGELQ